MEKRDQRNVAQNMQLAKEKETQDVRDDTRRACTLFAKRF